MRQGSSTGNRTMMQRCGITRDLMVCGLFTALTAVGAFIKIVVPVEADTVSFTLQQLLVLLVGLLLGSKKAFLSMFIYPLVGLVGIPVFARSGGPPCLTHPTFGFLLGLALAAYMMGKIVGWVHTLEPRVYPSSTTMGYAIYYGMEILYLCFITHFVAVTPDIVGQGTIFAVYCLSTMIPNYVLCVLAVTMAERLRPSMGWPME